MIYSFRLQLLLSTVVLILILEQYSNAFMLPSSHSVAFKNDNSATAAILPWELSAFRNKKEELKDEFDPVIIDPPPSVSSMAVVRRSLPLYLLLLGLNILTFIDLGGFITSDAIKSMLLETALKPEESDALLNLLLNNARTVFFGLSAFLTAYLGAERQDVGQTQAPVTSKNALFAPIFAGGTLFVLYIIILYTKLNPGLLYRIFTSFFGWICFTELLQAILALSPLGIFLAKYMVQLSPSDYITDDKKEGRKEEAIAANGMSLNPPEGESRSDILALQACGLPAAVISLAVIVVYWLGVTNTEAMTSSVSTLRSVAFTNNYIAESIGLITLGQIAIESYVAGCALLSGLFLYDALSVFKSDAMVTVATTIEAPVKLLFATVLPTQGRYPFGVLGLGDIVIPGVFIAMLRQFDIEQWYDENVELTIINKKKKASNSFFNSNKKLNKITTKKNDEDKEIILMSLSSPEASTDLYASADTPYFTTGLVSYAVGLGLTFVVLYMTGKGQPALFYIVPSLLIGSSGTALIRQELSVLWSYKGARAAAAGRARKDLIEESNEKGRKEGGKS